MTSRWRMVLALIGLMVIALSLAALAYALWPVEPIIERQPMAPTLFVSPQSWLRWGRLG